MRMYDIIMNKRNRKILSDDEIRFFIEGVTTGEIPDYQISALLMAIYFNGMNEHETAVLTRYMARSGDMADLSAIPGVKTDKHSTGGVGDKTTLITAPITAACGVPVAKMSGRGLGHTGGTIDKLESIPGFQTSLSKEQFYNIVRSTGLSIIGQTGNIAPADKKLYALRDVTATVDNISLIAASVMSKKLAAGSDAILLDVKTGGGAFMKTFDESIRLASAMVSIGEREGRPTSALITNMDVPLGNAIGNSLEVIEAVEVLNGSGPDDVRTVCVELSANMLYLAGYGTLPECRYAAEKAVSDGSAFNKFKAMVQLQGGKTDVLDNTSLFEPAPIVNPVIAQKSGYINHMDTEAIGTASVMLGAGRAKKDDAVDYSAGIILRKKTGDYIRTGEIIAELHTSSPKTIVETEKIVLNSYAISQTPVPEIPLIYARVTKDSIVYYKNGQIRDTQTP